MTPVSRALCLSSKLVRIIRSPKKYKYATEKAAHETRLTITERVSIGMWSVKRPNAKVNRRLPAKLADVLLNNQLGRNA